MTKTVVRTGIVFIAVLGTMLAACQQKESREQADQAVEESQVTDSGQTSDQQGTDVTLRNPTVNIDAANPDDIEKGINLYFEHEPVAITDEGQALHNSLTIVDWHTDTLLWKRDILQRSTVGHADLPRLQEGNVVIQMFTVVTKSPANQNYEKNSADAADTITGLAKSQGWPEKTYNSLLERGLYQAEKLNSVIDRSAGAMRWIKSKEDLEDVLAQRTEAQNHESSPIGALLGAEGGHVLEGDIANLQKLYDAGFRMVGLTHFFDNDLGGSLHGAAKVGLTDFGRAVVQRLDEMNMIIDLSHASEAMAYEVLDMTNQPVVVSHTGFKGACDTPRNFTDNLMKKIAAGGGLIAVGFWDAAVCDPNPAGIAKALKYGVDLVGEDHVALGSDWDGATKSIMANEINEITQELLNLGLSHDVIRKVMGGNSLRFLRETLPARK